MRVPPVEKAGVSRVKASGRDGGAIPCEPVFAYGTLQLESVQLSSFGRRLDGRPDTLSGYALVPLAIEDPAVIAVSGKAEHTMARYSGSASDVIRGTVLLLTPHELAAADAYEVAAVTRVSVVVDSGAAAWAYVDASRPGPD